MRIQLTVWATDTVPPEVRVLASAAYVNLGSHRIEPNDLTTLANAFDEVGLHTIADRLRAGLDEFRATLDRQQQTAIDRLTAVQQVKQSVRTDR